jgi:hypothetical protein
MRTYKAVVLISILAGLLVAAGHAQSLGEAARQLRQNKPSKTVTAAPRVITNDDMPPGSAAPPTSKSGPQASSPGASDVLKKPSASDDPGGYEEWVKAGKQWQTRILAQKAKIQSTRSYVDKLRASVHFAAKNPNYDAAIINAHELQKVDEAKRLEKQLIEDNAALQSAQEALRTAGYGSSIYDPQEDTGKSTAPPGSIPN